MGGGGADGRRAGAGAGHRAGRLRARAAAGLRTPRSASRGSACPAASGSGSRWPGRWSGGRGSWCWTIRCPRWTCTPRRWWRPRCGACSRETTALVVAHRPSTVMLADRVALISRRTDRRGRHPPGTAARQRGVRLADVRRGTAVGHGDPEDGSTGPEGRPEADPRWAGPDRRSPGCRGERPDRRRPRTEPDGPEADTGDARTAGTSEPVGTGTIPRRRPTRPGRRPLRPGRAARAARRDRRPAALAAARPARVSRPAAAAAPAGGRPGGPAARRVRHRPRRARLPRRRPRPADRRRPPAICAVRGGSPAGSSTRSSGSPPASTRTCCSTCAAGSSATRRP